MDRAASCAKIDAVAIGFVRERLAGSVPRRIENLLGVVKLDHIASLGREHHPFLAATEAAGAAGNRLLARRIGGWWSGRRALGITHARRRHPSNIENQIKYV